jgi:hypothetical protein
MKKALNLAAYKTALYLSVTLLITAPAMAFAQDNKPLQGFNFNSNPAFKALSDSTLKINTGKLRINGIPFIGSLNQADSLVNTLQTLVYTGKRAEFERAPDRMPTLRPDMNNYRMPVKKEPNGKQ